MDNMEIEEQMTNMVNATAVSVLLTNIGNSTSVIADTTDSTITAVTQSHTTQNESNVIQLLSSDSSKATSTQSTYGWHACPHQIM